MVNGLSLRNIAMPIDCLMLSTKNDADVWRHVYVKYIWRTEGKGLSMSPKHTAQLFSLILQCIKSFAP